MEGFLYPFTGNLISENVLRFNKVVEVYRLLILFHYKIATTFSIRGMLANLSSTIM